MSTLRQLTLLLGAVSIGVGGGCRSAPQRASRDAGGAYEVKVRLPDWKSRPLPELDSLFAEAQPGKTMVIRLRVANIGSSRGVLCDDIRVERGSVTFYTQDGQFTFVPDKVRSKPNDTVPERTFGFRRRPNINCNFGGDRKNRTAQLFLNAVEWGEEAGYDTSLYDCQPVGCLSDGNGGAIVELKVHFGDDYSGSLKGWTAYKFL